MKFKSHWKAAILMAGRKFTLTLLICWLTLVIMLPSNPLQSLPHQDNGVFLYSGQQILLGKIPYRDFWDHKGPLIYYINALGLMLGDGTRWGVWLLEFAFMTVTAGGIYRVARSQWGQVSGFLALAGWTYGEFIFGSHQHFADSNYTETYSILFNVLAVLFWVESLRRRERWPLYFLIGLVIGGSFILRPNNIGIGLAITLTEMLSVIWRREPEKVFVRVGLTMLGTGTVLMVTTLWFLLHGALPDLIDAVIRYNLIYMRSGVSSMSDVMRAGLGWIYWLPIYFYLAVGLRLIFNSLAKQTNFVEDMFACFLLLGWPIEMVLTAVSHRVLLHYYILWIPYVAWLMAGGVPTLLPKMKMELKSFQTTVLLVSALILAVTLNRSALEETVSITKQLIFARDQGTEATSAIARYVEAHTGPGDTVLVWGNEAWINFFSGRRSPTKYVYQYPLFMPGYTSQQKVSEFYEELAQTPPALILEPPVDTDEMPRLESLQRGITNSHPHLPSGMSLVYAYIDIHYCKIGSLHDVVIYQRRQGNPSSDCQ